MNLLVAASRTGVEKAVLAGFPEEPPADEPPPVPASPYAASKWAASGYARMFHAVSGRRTAVARILMVCGPGRSTCASSCPACASPPPRASRRSS